MDSQILKILIISFFLLFFAFPIQAANLSDIEKIDINSAPLKDLVKVIHIGESRAKELISLRPFSSLDDLARIKGISKTRAEDIKKQGLAWVKNVENNLNKEEIKEAVSQTETKKGLAAVGSPAQIPESSNSLFVSLIALVAAIFSGVIILILKKRY